METKMRTALQWFNNLNLADTMKLTNKYFGKKAHEVDSNEIFEIFTKEQPTTPQPSNTVSRTQGEWKVNPIPPYQREIRVIDADGNKKNIALANSNPSFAKGEAEANAAYICKAVNNFDNLLAMCQATLDDLYSGEIDNPDTKEAAIQNLKEAIQKAGRPIGSTDTPPFEQYDKEISGE
jgi:hypothetical protein